MRGRASHESVTAHGPVPMNDSPSDPPGISGAIFPILLVIAAWPSWALAPAIGLDASGSVGLVLAHVDGFRFGRDIGHTYGPLGFLPRPFAMSPSGLAGAILYAALGCSCLAFSVVTVCARRFDRGAGMVAAGALVISAPLEIFGPEIYSLALVLVACLVTQGELSVLPKAFPLLVGVAAALQTLVKPTAGAIAIVAVAITVLTGPKPRGRTFAFASLGYVGGFIVLWLVAGQRLADIPSWANLTLGLSAGYTDAMATEDPTRAFEYLVIAVMVGGVVAYGFQNVLSLPDARARAARLTLLALTFWMLLKEAFVRHDLHSAIAFYALGIIALAVAPRSRRSSALGAVVAAAVVMTSVALLGSVPSMLDPSASVKSFFAALTTVARTSDRAQIDEVAATQARKQYAVPNWFLRRIADRTVHVDPAETSVVWAYDLDWRPVPVFQSYLAYTADADSLNARVLAGRTGPSFVLRGKEPTVDGRNGLWESPRYMLALACTFSEVDATDHWQLLERGAQRCSPSRPLSTMTAAPGETVRIPAPTDPGAVVVATVEPHRSIRSRLESLLLKPRRPFGIRADGVLYRVTDGSASGPMIVRMPPEVWAPGFDGATAYRTLTTAAAATYRFREVPLRKPNPS